MEPPSRSRRVAIAYNSSNEPLINNDLDLISERAVKDEADGVFRALKAKNHQPFYFPIDDIHKQIPQLINEKPEVIFNLCEGYRGNASYEMFIAGVWELLGIPYTGNTPLTLGIAQNKVLTKRLLDSKRIPTPVYQVYRQVPDSTYLTYPLIAKPSREDASLGITQDSVILNLTQLKNRVQQLLEKYRQPILVEKLIEGREFNVSILGNNPSRVLAISEINFDTVEKNYHKITSYEAKWLEDHPMYKNTPPVCPARVNAELKRKLEEAALITYKLLGGRDYGRVDFRVDKSEHIYVLEYNPNPDISPDAGYSNALRAAGMLYENFIEFLIHQSLNRSEYD